MRDATVEVLGEEASLRGPAFTVGGGVQYFFNPKLALDAGVQFTAGKFSEAEALGVKIDLDKYAEVKNSNSARVSVGLRFYPKWGSQK
ncbi:MAG: outer membrane protein [Gemmatimonas sp.]